VIELSDTAATVAISCTVVGALAWFAFLSVGSAAHAGGWARRHMRTIAIGAAVLGATGLVALLWLRPVWLGIALVYIAGIIWVMARSVRATLRRVEAIGGAEITPGRRRLLLLTTAKWMWTVAAGLVVVTVVDWVWRGPLALADAVLGAVFAWSAWSAGNFADRLGRGAS